LTGRARKIQREGRHIFPQIVDMENQLFRQIRTVALPAIRAAGTSC
jgi:hypothetical protein